MVVRTNIGLFRCILKRVNVGFPENYKKSVVLIHRNEAFAKSEALLRIAESLDGIYYYLKWLKFIPRNLRDWVYDLIAKHRHNIILN